MSIAVARLPLARLLLALLHAFLLFVLGRERKRDRERDERVRGDVSWSERGDFLQDLRSFTRVSSRKWFTPNLD